MLPQSKYKCVNCGGTHAAWATECPEREKEVEKMKEMARYRPRYHPVPAYFSIHAPSVTLCPSPASSWGTPVASSTSEGSGTESSDSPAVGAAPSATRSSTGLQTSQWSVVQRKKKGKKGSSKSQSTATAPASVPRSQQPRPVATDFMEIDSTPSNAPSSTQSAEQPATPALSSEGVQFAPLSQSIHAPRSSKRTPRQVLTRQKKDDLSTSSSGSRKSVRIMKRVEAASQTVNMEALQNHLLGDNPALILTTSEPDNQTDNQSDNQSEFEPSSSSALTDITDQPALNARHGSNPRKRRHTQNTSTYTQEEANFRSAVTNFGSATDFNQISTPKHTYSKKPTRTPRL